MEYSTLNSNIVLFKINEKALTPYYDIVWSFDYYATSIPEGSQLGFCVFLQDQEGVEQPQIVTVLTDPTGVFFPVGPSSVDGSLYLTNYAGSNGFDLGYGGYNNSIDKGIVGAGFDSTGCFALSASLGGGDGRDGINENDRVVNTLSLRGEAPTYSWSKYSVNIPLSSYDFNVIDTRKKTIRTRLGNIGQTLYIDFRYSPLDDYVNILTQDITYTKSLSSRFKPGITFVKPVSGTAPVPTIRFSNFTIEGRELLSYTSPISSIELLPTPVTDTTCLIDECVCKPYTPPVPEPYSTPPEITTDPALFDITRRATIQSRLDRATNAGIDTGFLGSDIYNFGYTLALKNNDTNVVEVLYRTDYFNYKTIDNVFTLSLFEFDRTWTLEGLGINYTNNSNVQPTGVYGNYTISYINE